MSAGRGLALRAGLGRVGLARAALYGLAPACALGTFASEITVGVALAVALGLGALGAAPFRMLGGPWLLAYAAVWFLMVPVSGNFHEGIGHVWPLAPLLVIPMLRGVDGVDAEPSIRAGLWAAAGLGLWGAAEGTMREAHGPYSHHLTLAYALLPPLGVALQRRSALALPMVLGVLGSRSSGALVALAVTAVLGVWAGFDEARGRSGARWRGPTGALLGMALTVLGLPFADPTEVHSRAILWTGGLRVAQDGPVGPGGYPAASALIYDKLEPGFWFPNHAHDSATQVYAVLGPAGWLCALLLVTAWFEGFGVGAAAGLAGVCVGSLTQDNFGDLEVIRAITVWGALTACASGAAGFRSATRR